MEAYRSIAIRSARRAGAVHPRGRTQRTSRWCVAKGIPITILAFLARTGAGSSSFCFVRQDLVHVGTSCSHAIGHDARDEPETRYLDFGGTDLGT
jgi:hypothetical protein